MRAARWHSVSQHNYYVLKFLYTPFAVSAIYFDQAAMPSHLSYSAQEGYGAKWLFDWLVICCVAANSSIDNRACCLLISGTTRVFISLLLSYCIDSGKWPTWRTISSIICLFESSTCFEQLCAHPQKDNCIDIFINCKTGLSPGGSTHLHTNNT